MSAMSWGTAAAGPWRRKTRAPLPLLLLLLPLVVLGLLSDPVVAERSKKYQMSDICKKYFLRDLYRKIDGAVLTSQNERELDCAITFQTHSILQRFMLRFDQLQLDCNDHLYIYDGAHAVGSYKICVCVIFFVAVATADQEKCDKTKCPGPLRYYESLRCKPVYEKEGDCCAKRYNCDHLKERSKNKCYVNGKEYEIDEDLKAEDANPCDIECTCRRGWDDGVPAFICAGVDCAFGPIKPGCYKRANLSRCCDEGKEICPEKPEDRATCVVDGKTYQDGEYFEVKNEPELNCICQPGYEGKNIEPFCVKSKRPFCSPEFRNPNDVYQNCAPVFYNDQLPQIDCHLSSRCQNSNDTVIHNHDDLKSGEDLDDENVCLFGNMKMHIGDELNRDTDYTSICVKCICEVPPVPTCQHLPNNECDVTKYYPAF